MSDRVRRLLLRLHPRRWRARFGEEFAAVLADTPLNAHTVLDAVGHAFRLQASLVPRLSRSDPAGAGRRRFVLRGSVLLVGAVAALGLFLAGAMLGPAVVGLRGPMVSGPSKAQAQILREEYEQNVRKDLPPPKPLPSVTYGGPINGAP